MQFICYVNLSSINCERTTRTSRAEKIETAQVRADKIESVIMKLCVTEKNATLHILQCVSALM